MSEGSVTMEPLREALREAAREYVNAETMGILTSEFAELCAAAAALAAPAGLDVERLAQAVETVSLTPVNLPDEDEDSLSEVEWMAHAIAAEYARLAAPSGEQEGEG